MEKKLNNYLYAILFLFIVSGKSKYQIGRVSLESEVFCKFLTFPAADFASFKRTTKPIYSQNFYPFEDQPIENLVSPYNLYADAREPGTNSFTCLDPARILMFDKDDNAQVDPSANYIGYIVENGESLDHKKISEPTKLYFFDDNHLVFILFTIHEGTIVSDKYAFPTPFQINPRGFWNIIDPSVTSDTEIPQEKALSDPEALFSNFLYNYNNNNVARGDFFLERFIAVTGFTEALSSTAYQKSFEPKFSRLGVNVQTKFYAMMTMYYSIRVYEKGQKNNDEFCRYLSAKAMLWNVQQTAPKPLSIHSVHANVDKIGGFLKHIEKDKFENPIELKASVLSLLAIGYNAYQTYEPWKYPMVFKGNVDSSIFGQSMLYTGGNTGFVIYGPHVKLPIGNYQVIFTFTAEWKILTPDNQSNPINIAFDVNLNGSPKNCGTFNENYITSWNWIFLTCTFSVSADNTVTEFRVYSGVSRAKYFSTIKLRKN